MRKILILTLTVILAFSFAGCSKNEVATIETLEEQKNTIEDKVLPFDNTIQFYTETGIGNWSNSLSLRNDGSFFGDYYDLNMGEVGENFEQGTYYWNEYWGEFDKVEKLTDYSYLLSFESLATEHEDGVESFENQFKYLTTINIVGVKANTDYILFLPNTPVASLPENVKETILTANFENKETIEIYVLYNLQDNVVFWCN